MMANFNYNQTIEYIDGTRDLNFEAARRWAQSNGTTFEEDISKREPYEFEHEETYMNSETGATETKMVKTPSLKRFFIIGNKPKPIVIEPSPIPEPMPIPELTEEELQSNKRMKRDVLLRGTQDRIDRYRNQKELGVETTDTKEVYSQLLAYMQYLRDYTLTENWWEADPLTFEEWKQGSSAAPEGIEETTIEEGGE